MQFGESWLLGWRPFALLALFCLALYLPGLAAIPPLDRDEARFAQATRQMLQSGDFLDIRFQDEARNNKPAGIYWLQAAAVAAFSAADSRAIWPYRLPSVLGATAAALLTFALGRALFRDAGDAVARRGAFWAAILLGGALGIVAEAHIAKTDAVLLAAITAGQGVLGLAYLRGHAGRRLPRLLAAAFWIAEAAAILVKGPIGPGLAIATAAALSIADRDPRWLRGLRPVMGLMLLVILVAPWLIAIETATRGHFLGQSFGHDFLAKLVAGQEAHGAPPFYYLLLALATFWPGSIFLVPALARGWRRRAAPAERFLLAWIVPAWIILELVPTKLPHYDLPLFPALALLAGRVLAEGIAADRVRWLRYADLVVRALWAVVTLVLAAGLVFLPLRFGGGIPLAAWAGAAAVMGLAIAMWACRRKAAMACGLAAALSLAVAVSAAAVLPGLDRLWLSRAAAALVADHPPAAAQPIVAVGYSEPSLVFLLGGRVALLTPDAAAAALAQGGEALVESRDGPDFLAGVAAHRLSARPLGRVRGLDYSNGHEMALTLYRVTGG